MSIAKNISNIQADLSQADQTVELVAVSKKQPMSRLYEALDAGHRVFGENRVQEAQTHWSDIRRDAKYPDLRLHLIGPLQSNKVKDAVALFDVIETIDREKIARKVSEELQKQTKTLNCYIQVNTGAENQKSGILPQDLPDFLTFCQQDCDLNIIGLMCIPPIDEPPAVHFALLHKLANKNSLLKLSMGMSSDYKKALPLGTTSVRLGTAVFGAREAI